MLLIIYGLVKNTGGMLSKIRVKKHGENSSNIFKHFISKIILCNEHVNYLL